ncbi:unnamed protein product [Spirodela intermedia]|uniref:Uncharacterized protein n=2 Tax=Spirodela intermedia TaxID=51605 RepID=A0A7I8IBY1_SPIIN|nr:unnamed protein product [Spirodela intermedia]CAA6655297.1 unnamed protein product [Spirodela intermedia]CAA7390520.1 unnamed protein product [Spirodela intermedia]
MLRHSLRMTRANELKAKTTPPPRTAYFSSLYLCSWMEKSILAFYQRLLHHPVGHMFL